MGCIITINAISSCYHIGLLYCKLSVEVIVVNSVDIGKYLAELRKYYKITQDELLLKLSEIYGTDLIGNEIGAATLFLKHSHNLSFGKKFV